MEDGKVEVEDCVVVGEAWVGRVGDIISLVTDGNYTKVSTVGGKFMVRKCSYALEARLPTKIFARASRECIFNLGQVKVIRRFDNKRLAFTMMDGSEVVMSKQHSMEFRRMRGL